MKKIGILGGGLTGLVLGSSIKKVAIEILEKEKECGGLCRSFRYKGYTVDKGGAHIIYSKNKDIINYVKKLLSYNLQKNRRNNKVYYKGILVKYPFENGIGDLPPKERFKCLYHFLNNKYPKPKNFKEWLYYNFGKEIADIYLIPYNKKIWKFNLEKMSLCWAGRVPKPPIEDILKSACGIPTEGYLHQLNFYYPKAGGIQALIESLIKKIKKSKNAKIITNFLIKKVYKESDKWFIEDINGLIKCYDELISTIPLIELAKVLENIPLKVKKAILDLRFNSLITIVLFFNYPLNKPFTAIYFPQKDIIFHRIAFPKNFSIKNVPPNKDAIIVEITTRYNSKVWKAKESLLFKKIVSDLKKLNIISNEAIIYKKMFKFKYGYVIYDLNYQNNIKIIKNYFNKIGIKLCGRFAEFEYLNMDQCIERALRIIK